MDDDIDGEPETGRSLRYVYLETKPYQDVWVDEVSIGQSRPTEFPEGKFTVRIMMNAACHHGK